MFTHNECGVQLSFYIFRNCLHIFHPSLLSFLFGNCPKTIIQFAIQFIATIIDKTNVNEPTQREGFWAVTD